MASRQEFGLFRTGRSGVRAFLGIDTGPGRDDSSKEVGVDSIRMECFAGPE